MIQQLHLASGSSRMTIRADHPRQLRPGASMVLKDSAEPERRWTVLAGWPLPWEPPRGWSNNI